jgi:hypothetical protein
MGASDAKFLGDFTVRHLPIKRTNLANVGFGQFGQWVPFATIVPFVNDLVGFVARLIEPAKMARIHASTVPARMSRLMCGRWSGAMCQFAYDAVWKTLLPIVSDLAIAVPIPAERPSQAGLTLILNVSMEPYQRFAILNANPRKGISVTLPKRMVSRTPAARFNYLAASINGAEHYAALRLLVRNRRTSRSTSAYALGS